MRSAFFVMVFAAANSTAYGSLIYELTPDFYTATPGSTVQTFATVTNTGPEILYHAYNFVNPGTVPVSGVTGQLPPLILQPGDRVSFTAGSMTITSNAAVGVYTFREGAGYHPGLGVPDVIEAGAAGTVRVVPEPAAYWLLCAGLLFVFARSFRASSKKPAGVSLRRAIMPKTCGSA